MKLVTADQMRAIEGRAAEAGLPSPVLMETAGLRVAAATAAAAGGIANRSVLVLVGPGNNGGDGLVAARHLHDWGARVHLYLWNRRIEADANFAQTERRGIPTTSEADDADRGRLTALLNECSVVLDALLGTGRARPIAGSLRDVIQRLAAAQAGLQRPAPLVVAVDLPTGLNADTGAVDPVCVRADVTVTLGYPKVGLVTLPGAEAVGRLVVADIGIPDHLADDVQIALATDADIAPSLPTRPRWSHKGTFGKALVVAGSRHYVGAAALAAAGAGRAGAGLVTLACPEQIYPSLAARLAEPTFLPLSEGEHGVFYPDAAPAVARALDDYDALLVGPGLGRHRATADFLRSLLDLLAARSGGGGRQSAVSSQQSAVGSQQSGGPTAGGGAPGAQGTGDEAGRVEPRVSSPGPSTADRRPPTADRRLPTADRRLPTADCRPPLVLDADALNLLADIPDWWQKVGERVVLTPHPGEMARLVGRSVAEVEADRLGCACALAVGRRKVVLLKGPHSIVATPDGRATIIPIATPALATAGSGDVLAGAIVGLLAQGLAPADAALVAAYVHARAGLELERELGPAGVLAGDLLPRLPLVMQAIRRAPTTYPLVWIM
ncbi:MAG: NAD(P)H-hydrate epimerase [Chloroflexi bacterium]|nr:NAD(P)H-hydrate epimerase [Chloroflexota bacterium]